MSSDRYDIKGKIGQGGVGAVYRAYDNQLNRDVAIKRVLPDGGFETEDDATVHLLKEATSLSSIQHPHIVTVYDSGVDEDGPYVVMELLDGRTLDEMVERSILTISDFKEVAMQSQEALIAAQYLNLVHRDLKPSNVMVTWLPSGRFQVKIVDFGLAKFSPKPSLQTIDHGDSVFGSIFFMAPEQFERTELDQRTDMYAIGCVYYFCLTGTYPFDGETAAEVMEAHLDHKVRPIKELRPDIPDWVNDWVMWHINRDMAHRPENARSALESFLLNDQARADEPEGTSGNSMAGAVPARPNLGGPGAGTAAQNARAISAPQPIAPPKGQRASVHTSAQRAARALTGSQAISANAAAPTPTTATQATAAQVLTSTVGTLPSQKKGLGPFAKIIITAIIAFCILVFAVLILNSANNSKQSGRVGEISELAALKTTTEIELNKKDLKLVLDTTSSLAATENRDALYQALYLAKSSDGIDIDRAIADRALAEKTPRSIRIKLFDSVLRLRKNKNLLTRLLTFIDAEEDAELAQAAMKATELMVTEDNVESLIKVIVNSKHDSVRQAAELVLFRLVKRSSSKAFIGNQILDVYNVTTEEDKKFALLRLLGPIGGDKYLDIFKKGLDSQDKNFVVATIIALKEYPSQEAFDLLADKIALVSDPFVREKAFKAAVDFASVDRKISDAKNKEMWGTLADEAANDQEKLRIIKSLAKIKAKWPISILEDYDNDQENDTISRNASNARDHILKRIEK